jgi:uncharacterized membrane protein
MSVALWLFVITIVVFLVLDALMLTRVLAPMFENHIGEIMRPQPFYGAAVLFYVAYIAGLVWLVSWPAFVAGAPHDALVKGAVLGALAYGTYEFTNMATLKLWTWKMVALDLAWGTVLTGVSAWAGVTILRLALRMV